MKSVRLGNFIEEHCEKNKKGEDIPVFSVTNTNGFCTEYFSKDVSSKDKSNYKIVHKGFFAYNPSRINVGSVDWLRNEEKVIVSPLYNVFSVSPELEKQYLYYFLKSERGKTLIKSKAEGSVRDNLKFSILADFPIPLPSIEEQRKFVAKLDKSNDLIFKYKRLLEYYDTLIKSRFIEMFGDNPVKSGKWNVETLGDVCSSIVRGPFGSALKKEFFVPKSDKTIKVYEQKHAIQKSSTIGSYYITQEKYEELKRFECKPGDFLMSCSGTMGEFYQLPDKCEKGIINQALCKFTLNNRIESLFFLEWMKQSIHNLETKGSGIQNVAAVSFIKQMPVFLPPMQLQNNFAAFVHQIDKSKFEIWLTLQNYDIIEKRVF